jgi:hypothetical protein
VDTWSFRTTVEGHTYTLTAQPGTDTWTLTVDIAQPTSHTDIDDALTELLHAA